MQVAPLAKQGLTGITPNDQEQHNLDGEADAIRQQHDTIDRPLAAQEKQRRRVARGLVQQVLESRRREVEERQAVVADVVGVVGPDLPACRLVLGVELIWRNGLLVFRRAINFQSALPSVFGRGHHRETGLGACHGGRKNSRGLRALQWVRKKEGQQEKCSCWSMQQLLLAWMEPRSAMLHWGGAMKTPFPSAARKEAQEGGGGGRIKLDP